MLSEVSLARAEKTSGTLPEKPAGSAGLLKYTVQTPGFEWLRIGPVLGLSTGGGWRHVE